MKLHWRYCATQWYRRYGKVTVVVGICLAMNFIGHMLVCLPKNQDELSHAYGVKDISYAQKRTEPKKYSTFLVVAILTGPSYFDRRKTIRETWLSDLSNDVMCLFFIGTKDLSNEDKAALEYEKQQHGDLVLLGDFVDSYQALTSKVMKSFQWLDHNVDFQYVLKADDDTFARIDMIKADLKGRKWAVRFYWGFFDGRARVKTTGQWAEKSWVLCDTYLPHARGGGYILSEDLVQYIAMNSHLLKHFNSEDVSVGAWLGPLDIERQHDPRFDTEYRSRGCNNAYIVTHKQEARDMRDKHTSLANSGKLCASEFKVRNSYNYNWAVAPSSCCIRDDPSIP